MLKWVEFIYLKKMTNTETWSESDELIRSRWQYGDGDWENLSVDIKGNYATIGVPGYPGSSGYCWRSMFLKTMIPKRGVSFIILLLALHILDLVLLSC